MSRPFLALSRPCLLFRVGRGWPVAGRRGLVRSRGRLADLASLARITGLPVRTGLASLARITGLPVRTGLADLASLARITGLPVRTGLASLARITGLPVRTGLADLASLARITGLPVRTGIIRPGARIRHCRYQVLERAYGILNHGGKDPPGAG